MMNGCKPSLLEHPAQLVFKPLAFPFPQVEQVTLSNGVVVYLLEDHELPLFNLTALIKTGSVYDPADKVGLASLTGTVMRTGGTRFMSGEDINETLEFMAGSMETGINRNVGSASLSVLKKDTDQGLKIFFDVLMYPVFSEEQVDLARKKQLEAIRRRNDNPQDIAFRELRKGIFENNPRGRFPTLESIAKIKREDLVSFHRTYFHPNNIIVGVAGDFKRDEIIRELEALFKEWVSGDITFPPLILPEEREEGNVYYAYKALPQSTIVMGHLTIGKADPDFFPLTVLNFIVGGGGFKSRLMTEIRSNRGLAYSVGSIYSSKVDHGIFAAYCFTKSDTTLESITLIKEIVEKVKEEGITLEELEWAKSSIINNFIFEFTSPSQIVNKRVAIAYNKLPKEFLETYRERIMAITVDEVNRVAADYLHPDRMVLVVVGNSDDFDGPLSQLGPVRVITLEETL
jgi:predicted Zn-dependent peptidase